MNGWYFDLYSALVGAALTLVLVLLGLLVRQPLLRGWQRVGAGLRRFFVWLAAGAEEQYRNAVADWAQQAHALAALGPLEPLFLPPRLIPPPPPPDLKTEASEVCESLPLGAALRGHHRLLMVGELSSGRTALLAYLALAHARKEAGSLLGLPVERVPLYVHLGDMDWPSSEEGKELQDSGTLVKAAVRSVGGRSAARRMLRQNLEDGTALILVDGLDELDRPERERAAAWLAIVADSLPDNLWVVATGPRGYAPLTDAGFVPLWLEKWERPQMGALVAHCADLLRPAELEENGDEQPSLQAVRDTLAQALEKGTSVLELGLRAWQLLEGEEPPLGRMDLFVQALERLLGSPEDGEEAWLTFTARAALGNLALMMYREGRTSATKGEIKETLKTVLPPPGERPPRASLKAFRALTAAGSPLTPRGPDRYGFVHTLWQAYLIAEQMTTLPSAAITEHLDDPRWLPVLDFYAEVGQMDPVVEAWLAQPDDIWRTRLRTAARWAALAPPDLPWRNGIMVLLARTFIDPALPTWVRERLAEALAQTNDPGVPLFLRQALRHPMEAVRAAAAQGMGCLRERVDLTALAEALEDPHEEVRTAAAVALGNVGTPAAIERLTQVLADGEEALRVETARSLARAGDVGWKVLQEMIRAKDFLTRRAAAHGLGNVKAPWARELLERVVEEDDEWIVRSAAAAALTELETAPPVRVDPPFSVSEMGWLISWAAERGEGVGTGKAALRPLLRALEEGEPAVRRAAAQALGVAGGPEHVTALRQAVDDPVPEVAQTAFWALKELASRHDLHVQ